MTTSLDHARETESDSERSDTSGFIQRLAGRSLVRELLVILAFLSVYDSAEWPYVTRLRDVVVDTGDPYLMTGFCGGTITRLLRTRCTLQRERFLSAEYTLAFSEHSYGLALLLFPLYALGMKPLTVHAIALFFAFRSPAMLLFAWAEHSPVRPRSGGSRALSSPLSLRFNQMSQVIYAFAAVDPPAL